MLIHPIPPPYQLIAIAMYMYLCIAIHIANAFTICLAVLISDMNAATTVIISYACNVHFMTVV